MDLKNQEKKRAASGKKKSINKKWVRRGRFGAGGLSEKKIGGEK